MNCSLGVRISLAWVVFAAGCATTQAQKSSGEPEPATEEKAIEARLTAVTPSSGLLVGVQRDDATFYRYGGVQIDEHTPVPLGAMTRPLTATVVASYIADGSLTYDTGIGGTCKPSQLSAFCFRGAAATFEHLVQDTSGLPGELPDVGPKYAEADLQDFLANFQLSIEPGARFRASAAGYATLGMMLSRRTRVPFADALAQRVTSPAGMSETAMRPQDQVLPLLWPAQGLSSTAHDLLRFAALNVDPGDDLRAALQLTQRPTTKLSGPENSQVAHGWFYLERADTYWYAATTPASSVFVAFSHAGGGVSLVIVSAAPMDLTSLTKAGIGAMEAVQKF